MSDTQPTGPIEGLITPVLPAAAGLRLALDALPGTGYRSVSASAEGPNGELVTVTFSVGDSPGEEGNDE
jgi:hypothetical protein